MKLIDVKPENFNSTNMIIISHIHLCDKVIGAAKPFMKVELYNMLKINLHFFEWRDAQKMDENKRCGKPNNLNTNFYMEESFKKLEID
ncbi:hypothetical protein BDFB_003872 [Asbolus verrucosus]|uniref:Uncharacterized protein n=1 Tax=Asbolus verrucosus TaxID=1661398 RepID=A0A482VY62_ASBVE|nr:hypothetical protein BDFB_003872 [Asbolus verrucosus]